LRGEVPVNVVLTEFEQILNGRIDALVLQDQCWLVLAESKQAKLSYSMAIPQALAI
jgi:hypothetical protein